MLLPGRAPLIAAQELQASRSSHQLPVPQSPCRMHRTGSAAPSPLCERGTGAVKCRFRLSHMFVACHGHDRHPRALRVRKGPCHALPSHRRHLCSHACVSTKVVRACMHGVMACSRKVR